MSQVERRHLLTATQMAQFACDGFLLFDGFVPREFNEAVHAAQIEGKSKGYRFWHETPVLREVFELPEIKGIIQSLVGRNPVYDHSYLHVVGAKHLRAQEWHADSIIDTRPFAYDIQAFYFSHDTPPEMGPTLVLPGSHLRKTSNGSIARYKNIVGQIQLAGRAGTIGFLHHGIWHCAQPNFTDTTRYMFKLRLRPGEIQRNLFNTDGYDSPEVHAIFDNSHNRFLGDEARVEHVKKAKFWRYLVGNDSVDVSFEGALTRMGI